MPDDNTETKSQSIASKLVENLSPKQTVEEETKKVETETKSEEKEIQDEKTVVQEDKTEDSNIEDSLVTEELIQVMGLPKGFLGKPLKDIGQAYRESLKWGNDNNKELIQLRTSVDELKQQVTQAQAKKSEEDANKETEKILGEIPDPATDPVGFSDWLKKRDQIMEDKLTKIFDKKSSELAKSFNENPILKKAEQLAIERTEQSIISIIKDGLPEENKQEAGQVLDAWLKDNEEDYAAMVESGLYKAKPERLAKDVLTWFKAQSFDKLKTKKDSELIKEVHKRTKDNLKELGKVKQPEENKKDRSEQEKPNTTSSRIVETLLKNQGLSV